jgi:UDP:flavonoid glycosyltransferase YjiC (YdhE family)
MSKLLYAWEFGANLGHVGAFLPLARALRARGHEIRWAVAQTTPAACLLAKEGFAWVQAPTCAESPREGPPLSYNDILLRFGYARDEDLLRLVVAWRELLLLSGAQTVLANYAPTAILAARTLGIPVVLFGSGFHVPPRQRPLPSLRPWLPLPPGRLDALEREALASINAVIGRFGLAPFDAVAQLFDVAEDTLLGFPELDHYAERGPARYWGNLPDAGVGDMPAWPKLQGKRIFGYLRTGTRHHEAALAALHALGAPTVVYFPDAPPALLERYAAPHLVFSAAPLDLAQTASDADAGITYASMSTATSFLLKGKPLLLLPGHLEQFLLARRVEEMGAGLVVNPEQPPLDLKFKLRRVLFEGDFTLNAQAFARKYANFSQNTVTGHLISRIEQIAADRMPPGGTK